MAFALMRTTAKRIVANFERNLASANYKNAGQKGESKFWRQKMRTFHGILDVNKDGVISFDDFQLLADRFVNLGHMSDDKAQEFRELIKKIWEKQWGEIGPYNLVTVEQYLEDMLHVVNDKERSKKVHAFLPYLFEALDKDQTGEVTLEEYKLFFECLGLSDEDAVFTFRVIDSNSDGKISKREFVHHGKEFFLSEDETKISRYFWGPLVQK
ncbi:reticulocalbin [Holotrichia oblita]|uniref:Reticulocalbin n=1 Tax=Holotrichia oblita TaxID=644536 RepID=A0ACB9SJ04_HOLOL|nr:reticulocalbin [Holotrichia oblita]